MTTLYAKAATGVVLASVLASVPGGLAAQALASHTAPALDARPAGDPAIAVASSLRAAWPALERAWRTALPDVGARPTFGASHTLARQIARGAPFELFLAADEVSLASIPAGRRDDATNARYATGRLVLVMRTGTADAVAFDDDPLRALGTLLDAVPTARLAIADPDHAPYGQAAREVLDDAGLWPLAPGRRVTGENAAQTLQFVLAGGVEAALVPASLVADGPPPALRVLPIDPRRHAPLVHRLVALPGASAAARALGAWFASEDARAALAAAGLDPPP